MVKQNTTKEVIAWCKLVHLDIDYSQTVYVNARTPMYANCLINDHGEFKIPKPRNHYGGEKIRGCKKCQVENMRTTPVQFFAMCIAIFGALYDYSKTIFVKMEGIIKVMCRVKGHGEFEVKAGNHVHAKSGCPKCAITKRATIFRKTIKQFIKDAIKVHGSKYCYDLVDYINNKTNVIIICPFHGPFAQTPKNHITHKCGCKTCGNISQGNKLRMTLQEFLERALKAHPLENYDYSLVVYKKNDVHVKIICSKPGHGMFKQRPMDHIGLQKQGCPKCMCSKGEKMLLEYFHDAGIEVIQQHTYDDCKDKKVLKFDFYIPKWNIIVEYDGEHHFEPVYGRGGGLKGFIETVRRDNIKNKYCEDNGIYLIRIPYFLDNPIINLRISLLGCRLDRLEKINKL